jgi:hypothetical protein
LPCYDIVGLPPDNLKLEALFEQLRCHQRRISGRKSTRPLRDFGQSSPLGGPERGGVVATDSTSFPSGLPCPTSPVGPSRRTPPKSLSLAPRPRQGCTATRCPTCCPSG